MFSLQILGSILLLTALTLGEAVPSPTLAFSTPAATPNPNYDSSLASIEVRATPAPVAKRALSGPVTWIIQNSMHGMPVLSIRGTNDYNALPPLEPVDGTFATQTSIVVPSGWAGEFTVDKVGKPLNPAGSRIEGNWGVNDPQDNVAIDVSYVMGFSVPITCSCGAPGQGPAVVGCNKALFALGNGCDNAEDPLTGSPVCLNNAPTYGPPSAFFAPCRGAAYTYPTDDVATQECNTNQITCCVGLNCPAPSRQPRKRGLEVIRGRGLDRGS